MLVKFPCMRKLRVLKFTELLYVIFFIGLPQGWGWGWGADFGHFSFCSLPLPEPFHSNCLALAEMLFDKEMKIVLLRSPTFHPFFI